MMGLSPRWVAALAGLRVAVPSGAASGAGTPGSAGGPTCAKRRLRDATAWLGTRGWGGRWALQHHRSLTVHLVRVWGRVREG